MRKSLQSWRNLLRFILYYFSIMGLVRTLFVPWRREKFKSNETGIWKWVERTIFYLFAVVFGLIIRTITIGIGLVSLFIVIALFPLFIVIPISLRFENLVTIGSFGREWAYPVTYTLNKHGYDIRNHLEVLVIDHDKALAQTERILSRKHQQNVLIVGSQGIGKSTRLAYLARQMYRDLSVPTLNGKRLVQLFPEEMNAKDIQICIKEAISARNVVLVIENIERFNILGILEPYLDNNHFQMILTTDWGSYTDSYKHNENLMRACEVVEMYPPDSTTTVLYLADWVDRHHLKKRIDKKVISLVVTLTDKLIMNIPQPEKSIDILEELLTLPVKKIEKEHVEDIISQKTNVPLGVLDQNEKDILIHLEENLKQHVIGQDEALEGISGALKRGRAGVDDSPKPIGSFLFLGPTGVGKTHTAKMLAAAYFGGEHMMIRFDMSEFRELDSMNRFVERLSASVENTPFSLVFFDEIEKAHPDILNLFLQILDEGQLHTQSGRFITFRNTIIICTSNAGSRYMMKNQVESEELVVNHIVSEGILRPEFINRFNRTVLYRPLARKDIERITIILLSKLNKHLFKKHSLLVLVTDGLVEKLARVGHDPKFGARALVRVIQDNIETFIADALLSDPTPRNICMYINPHSIEKK